MLKVKLEITFKNQISSSVSSNSGKEIVLLLFEVYEKIFETEKMLAIVPFETPYWALFNK